MNYSNSPGSVRVDFFKESGKWYATEALDMTGFYNEQGGPVEAVRQALKLYFDDRYRDMDAVVLEPYHRLSFPVMIRSSQRL